MIAIAGLRENYRKLSREEELDAWEAGDHDALIRSQLPWVQLIAARVAGRRRFADVDLLVSAGHLALIQCLKTFDPRVSRLSTYCFRKVLWSMVGEIRRSHRGMSASGYLRKKRLLGPMRTWGDSAPAVTCDSTAEADAVRAEEAGLCRRGLAMLPERERWVLEQRYLFHRKLVDVGEVLGVTKERVRQIELRARRMLREALEPLGVTE